MKAPTSLFRLTLLALAPLVACGEIAEHNAGRAHWMGDLIGADSIAPGTFVERGKPIELLSPPYGATEARQAPDVDGLTVFPAFVDTRPAAYVTTEVWEQWTRVWAQPMYVPVTAFDPVLGPTLLPGAKPIFGVAPPSRFYSPFWQTWWFLVPPDTHPDAYTSVAQVLESGLPQKEGPNVYAAFSPEEIGPAHEANAAPMRPLTRDLLRARLPQQGWMDGKPIWFIHFGRDRFRIDERTKLVQPTVLYQFAIRGPEGEPVPIDILPRVGGTGVFRAPRPVDAVNGIPQFGALWQEYQVILSPRPGDPMPGIFIPQAMTELRQKVASIVGDAMVPVPGPVAENTAEKDQFILRVAVDGACFNQGDFPAGCIWLDTQASVENNLPGNVFVDTQRMSARALLLFNGVAP
jgi:hypothetical protein